MMHEKKDDINTRWGIREEIGFLTLSAPPENYLDKPEFIPLDQLKEFLESNDLKGIVISGEGRHFSAGANRDLLRELARDKAGLIQNIDRGKQLLNFFENLDIPVIAAIRGTCFGGGLEVALAAHIRICSKNALFAFPETNYGLMPGLGGTWRSFQNAGYSSSMKMILSGDVVNAEEALEMHLVDKISAGSDPAEEAFILLKKMTADKPMKVIRSVMQALRNARTLSMAEALREETKLFCELAAEEAHRQKI